MSAGKAPNSIVIMEEDEEGSKILRKIKESPHMVIGMVGWCGVVAYGLYGIKKRKQPLGIHLIHTRVIAQACVVGMLSFGVGYQIITEHIVPWYKNKFSSDAPSK
ncbi:hypothetical protein HAZT_HAZT003842 [Hyalella azteca]|uniref:Uncharacterized protein n=1 Tax=Hyalella azteca TaxID=294128 RepID=A0A6A0GX73_HYAAZ|nr:hypothetical protein HAZT_HAZT003842 [Hyalella azteca]